MTKVEIDGKTYCVETLIYTIERLTKEVKASAECHRLVLDKIRAEIEHLHYHPKLDYIKNDEVVEMALDIIDKYRKGEQGC